MEIKKIENKDYVMLPRLQHPGLKPMHVERDAFKAELKHVEGHGDYWLLYQQSKPHVVAHVQLPKAEAEFEIYRAREIRQLKSDFDKAIQGYLNMGEK